MLIGNEFNKIKEESLINSKEKNTNSNNRINTSNNSLKDLELKKSDSIKEPFPNENKNIIPNLKNNYLHSQINNQTENEPNDLNINLRDYSAENNNLEEATTPSENNNNSVIFHNSFIQISMQRSNLIRKRIQINTEIYLRNYFEKWFHNMLAIEPSENSEFINKNNLKEFNEKNYNPYSDHKIKKTKTLEKDLNYITEEIIQREKEQIKENTKNTNEGDLSYLEKNRHIIQNCLLNDRSEFADFSYEDTNTLNSHFCTKENNNNENDLHYFIDENVNAEEEKPQIFNKNYLNEKSPEKNNFVKNKSKRNLNEYSYDSLKISNEELKDKRSIKHNSNSQNQNTNKQNFFNENENYKKNNNEIIANKNHKISTFVNFLENFNSKNKKENKLKFFLSFIRKAFKSLSDIHQISTFRLFTKFSIASTKLENFQKNSNQKNEENFVNKLKSDRENLIKNNEDLLSKISERQKMIKKLEENLNDKAQIIFDKNDEIELLKKKIDNLSINNHKLNIIPGKKFTFFNFFIFFRKYL